MVVHFLLLSHGLLKLCGLLSLPPGHRWTCLAAVPERDRIHVNTGYGNLYNCHKLLFTYQRRKVASTKLFH